VRRLLVTTAALLAVGAAVATHARATGFADTPCPESGPGGIRVCPAAVVGTSYAVHLAGSGGCGPALPYQYRVLNGRLPPGLSVSKNGEIGGTPTSAGAWRFWIELSDQDPPVASWCAPKTSEREFLITVGVPPATVRAPYSFALSAGGDAPRTWSLASGRLPTGLALDPQTGLIAGTPEESGPFPLVFSGTDAAGAMASVDFTLTVYPQLVFTTARLPAARVGRPLHARLSTSGAVGPVTLSVVSGRFPIGVRLAGTVGGISGRPRMTGRYRFVLRAQDSLGRSATRSFVLVIVRGL